MLRVVNVLSSLGQNTCNNAPCCSSSRPEPVEQRLGFVRKSCLGSALCDGLQSIHSGCWWPCSICWLNTGVLQSRQRISDQRERSQSRGLSRVTSRQKSLQARTLPPTKTWTSMPERPLTISITQPVQPRWATLKRTL